MQKNYTMLFSAAQAKRPLRLLGVRVNCETVRKCVRAKYLLDQGHIRFIKQWSDESEQFYRVVSQWDATLYTVLLNGISYTRFREIRDLQAQNRLPDA